MRNISLDSPLLCVIYHIRCRYSQALKPIFDKTADTLLNEYPVSDETVGGCGVVMVTITGSSGTGKDQL